MNLLENYGKKLRVYQSTRSQAQYSKEIKGMQQLVEHLRQQVDKHADSDEVKEAFVRMGISWCSIVEFGDISGKDGISYWWNSLWHNDQWEVGLVGW